MKNTRKNTIKIGTFTEDKKGNIQGKIFALGLGVTPVMLEAQTSKEGKAYFRFIADPGKDGYEIGAAFPRDKDGVNYHSVTIESPMLPAPINAALFPDKETGKLNLIWNRQDESREPRAEATVNVNVQPQNQTQAQSKRSANPQLTM
jgi:uncharacterized protein (DUF736 family)